MDPLLVLVIALTAIGVAAVIVVVPGAIYLLIRRRKRRGDNTPSRPKDIPRPDKEDEWTNEKVFEIHRSYMQHEDTLIFHRTTLIATIQGFLLTAFGFSLQKFYEKIGAQVKCNFSSSQGVHPIRTLVDFLIKVLSPDTFQDITILEFNCYLIVIVLTGFFTSIIGVRSIGAARNAIVELQKHWDLFYYRGEDPSKSEFKILPGITGGGSNENRKQGVSFVTWVPWFFVGLWLLILCVRLGFMVFEGICFKFGLNPAVPAI